MKFSWTSILLIFKILLNNNLLVNAECCQTKEVKGDNAKAGFYSLVGNSDDVPDFCVDGCIYTKKDDEKPGTYYCFKTGGQMESKCSISDGSSCSQIEGWIEKYFEKECKGPANAILEFHSLIDPKYDCYGMFDYDGICFAALENTTIKLFRGSQNCSGKPTFQIYTKEKPSFCLNSTAKFYLSIAELTDWSVAYEREDVIMSQCLPLEIPILQTTKIMAMQKPLRFQKAPILLLNFTFNSNPMLLPDVRVLVSNTDWTGRYKDDKSCTAATASYMTEETDFDCNCKGVLGGGLKFEELHYPNENNQVGFSKMSGQLFWYGEKGWHNRVKQVATFTLRYKYYLVYGSFLRRNGNDQVCKSNLNITLATPEDSADTIMKSVPCIPPQIPETNDITISPNQTDEIMGMFTEVNGSLVFGNGDMFWLSGCHLVQFEVEITNFFSFPNFFTSQDPLKTPSLCSCLLREYVQGILPESREFTVDQVKDCYVKALVKGPDTEQKDQRSVETKDEKKLADNLETKAVEEIHERS